MSITVTKTSVIVAQNTGVKPLAKGNLMANGSEQALEEFIGIGLVYGSVSLDQMVEGDTVVIRQYIKLMDGYPYQMYGAESYSGVQVFPVIYFPAKATTTALKITLEQIAGDFRRYRHDFLWED